MSEQPQKQQEFKTVDIVDFSMQNNPLKVNDAFNQLISSKIVDRTKNFFALGLLFWIYDRPTQPTKDWLAIKFAKKPFSLCGSRLRLLRWLR